MKPSIKKIVQGAACTGALLGLAMASSQVMAAKVVVKPGDLSTTLTAPEFGRALARSGSYTAVAALQESVLFPGEPTADPVTNVPNRMQGAVYLFNGTNTVPERLYQFPGQANTFRGVGGKVALSGSRLAFTAANGLMLPTDPSAVYVLSKTNGVWPSCPTVNTRVDCSSLVSTLGQTPQKPIIKIPFDGYYGYGAVNIAVSDQYLAVANTQKSLLSFYRFDAAKNTWVKEFSTDEPDDRLVGAGLAIEGDKIVVSSPGSTSGVAGLIRLFQRDATTATWAAKAATYNSFSNDRHGRSLVMHSGRVAAAVTGGLAFYGFTSAGQFTAPQTVAVEAPNTNLALFGNTLAVGTALTEKTISIFKRDAASGLWSFSNGFNAKLVSNVAGDPAIFASNGGLGIDGDDVVVGWQGYSKLVGAAVHEKISLIDSCKNPSNLVANCSFDDPASRAWSLLTAMGGAASADYTGQQMRTTIYDDGSDMWHVQARTAVKLATAGTYKLRFKARADFPRSLVVNLGHNGSADNNWQSYGRVIVDLSTEMKTFELPLYGIPTDVNAVLDFNMGNVGTAAVTLDGVYLAPN